MLIVDVFAERPLEGNTLAVFPEAAGYSDRFMQSLAREMNFSESTFVSGHASDGSWKVRIFTPQTELPFAGHPTLGTAWVIRNLLSVEPPEDVTLELKVGKVPVTFEPVGNPEDAIPWLIAPEVRIFTPQTELPFAGHPTLGTAWVIRNLLSVEPPEEVTLDLKVGKVSVTFEPVGNPEDAIPWLTSPEVSLGATVPPEAMARALGLEPGDLDSSSPVQLANVGLTSVMVPVRSLEALGRCRPDPDAFSAAGIPLHAYVFCRQARDPAHQVAARYFFEANGPREDPATGSATASFGRYALEHDLFGEHFSLRIEQGHEMGRPSLLRLEGARHDGRPVIHVGGRVLPVSKGALFSSVR